MILQVKGLATLCRVAAHGCLLARLLVFSVLVAVLVMSTTLVYRKQAPLLLVILVVGPVGADAQ